MHDAIVIGAGPNGLTAAAHLARAGWKVLVLEAKAKPGGACRTDALTLPGFRHDVGAAFFPFGTVSPALVPLALGDVGLRFLHAPMDSAHPARDGTCATIGRDLEAMMRAFGPDGERIRELTQWFGRARERMLPALLGTLPGIARGLAMGLDDALTLASVARHSGRSFGVDRFHTEAARRVIPGLGLHADVGPDDPFGAVVGFMLAMLAADAGFPVAAGGAGSITDALLARVTEKGGELRCGVHVDSIVVREGRAVAVRTKDGDIEASRAIIADVGAPALYLRMLDEAHVPAFVRRAMARYPYGFGTFKVDWALDAAVPWSIEDCARSAVVHLGESVDDLARFTADVRAGRLPSDPYLLVGQPSLCDPSRAPRGQHALYSYTHVPSTIEGGWELAREAFADQLEQRIEGLAPGFRSHILARAISTPPDLEAMNENLVGGDLGGGSAAITHQLVMRPVFPYFRYRTPVRALYLGSSYTHPGTGVHGACGANAAAAALEDAT